MPKLTIDIEARLAQFQDSLNGIGRQGGRVASQLDAAFSGLKSTLVGLGASLSVGAFASFISKSIEAAANLDDLAEKTGASVEELSKLQQVARISGTEFGVVETFLIKLNKALNDTDEEAKAANRALAAIGLSASELRSLDPAQAMQRVAVAFSRFADSGGKTAAILALTGKSAAEALPFLKDLATETGIVAKVTAEQAAQAEELQKAIRRLGNSATEAAQAFTRDLVPPLSRLIELFNEAQRIAGGLGELMLLRLSNPIQTLTGDVQSLTRTLSGYREERDKLASGAGGRGGIADLERLDKQIKQTEKLLEIEKFRQRQQALSLNAGRGRLDSKDLGPVAQDVLNFGAKAGGGKSGAEDKRFDTAIKQLEQEALKVQELTRFEEVRAAITAGHYGKLAPLQAQRLEQLAAEVDLQREDARVQKEADAAAEESLKRQADLANKEDERLRNLREGYIDLVDPIEKFRKKLLEVDELLEKGLISGDVAQSARLLIDDQMQAALGMGDALQKSLKDTDDVARDLGLTFSSAFEDAIVGGNKFSDILKGLEKDLLRIGTRKLVTEPLAEAASEFFKTSGGIEEIFKSIGGFFGGPRADGGPVSAGMAYTVGERGPELFIPRGAGTIVPNGGAAASAVYVTQQFTIGGNVDRRSQSQIATAAGEGVRRALARNT